MNKIEQVSSNHHQMSLAGGRVSQREGDGIPMGAVVVGYPREEGSRVSHGGTAHIP